MPTLNLTKAAELLKMHPVTLQGKAKSGQIPGAKPGKCWVFVEEDLIDYIRSQYTAFGKMDVGQGETRPCSLKENVVSFGITNSQSMAKQYSALLELKTKQKRKK
ncbi:helix-turn-helix domain-containing protein [Methylomonas methanica]|uniref:helix-turn-helix domain-containing protein n=1 Tax=Methylomonas methanica TaxID=421 RepID=UPI0009DB1463|nr:helix-turn-helix domain-containing protein [Methylomonas methanica]